mgnify:CR=1 FL=1
MNEIEINKEPVELYKISGGEAKALIEQGLILLNGVTETQKRKKIVSGDILELNKQQYKVTFNKSAT